MERKKFTCMKPNMHHRYTSSNILKYDKKFVGKIIIL